MENELSVADDVLLDTYFFIKRFALSDQTAFGLDHTDTVVEYVPLILGEVEQLPLKRLGVPPASRPGA